MAVLISIVVYHTGDTVVAASLAALGDDLGSGALGVVGFDFITWLHLQRLVFVGGRADSRGQRADVIAASGGCFAQRHCLHVTSRRYLHHHLYHCRAGVSVVHTDVQRVARLEAISRRLEAVVGEEVHLRAHRAAGRGERGRNRLRCTLVVGLVLVGGGNRVAVAHCDGVVTRCGGAVAVGVDGARENAGVRLALGKRHLLNVGGAGGNGYDDGAITVQVRVVQLDVQRIAGSELRHDAVKDVVGEPQSTRVGLSGSGRLEYTKIESRYVSRPAGFAGVVHRWVREVKARGHDLDGKGRSCRHGELEGSLSIQSVLVGAQGCRTGVHSAHAGLGHQVAGGVLHHAGHGSVL